MKRSAVFLAAALVLFATSAGAYLPSFAELRQWWPEDRPLPGDLLLHYQSTSGDGQSLEVYIRRDGLWAKRVRLDSGTQPRLTWKWGLDVWVESSGRVRQGLRREASWDDWLFEPNVEVLLKLAPATWRYERGLGRYNDTFMWLFGARHDRAAGEWLGLLGTPLRAAAWQSANDQIGRVWFEYNGDNRYPDEIRFERPGRNSFVLRKIDAVWNPDAQAHGFTPPPQVRWNPEHQPQSPQDDGVDTSGD